MTTLSDIDLNISGYGVLFILLALAAIAASYFVYRKTIPPISNSWRLLLTTLRSMSLILILLLLFDPILSLTRRQQEKPVVAVLVDNSASMGLIDEKMDRPSVLNRILADPLFMQPGSDIQMQFFPFSHQLAEAFDAVPDSLELAGDGTDIRQALAALNDELSERYFAAVILLTDGADNLGENPARFVRNYPVAIYPIAIGDPDEQKDLLLSNFVTNEVTYAGKQVPVEVYIKNNGFRGNRIKVSLTQNGKTIDSQMVTLSGSGMEQKIRLHFTPQKEGLSKYEIKLPQLEGELTQANNTKSFYTKVLKSKLRILIVAGSPGADFSFVKRALESDKNVEVTAYVEKHRGQFYHGTALPVQKIMEQFDCFILLDYPRSKSEPGALNRLKEAFSKGKPVLFLPGRQTDYNLLWVVHDFLPFASKPVKGGERSIFLQLHPQGLHHPILRIYEDDLENKDSWLELPPIFTNINSVKLRTGASTLAIVDNKRTRSRRGRPIPLLVTHDSGKRKSAALLAYGSWRWHLLMSGVGKSNRNYQLFLQNCVRWLTTKDDSKLVRVTSNKEIFRSGEEVEFTAQVYFEDYAPVDGAEVTVQLAGASTSENLTLTNIGDGRYQGSFKVLDGGDYFFTGTAHQQGRVLGRDTGKFSVEEFSLEFQNTRMNEALLRRIADESGGEFYLANDISGLPDKMSFPPKHITLKSEWEIWTQTPVLIACLILLVVEWVIRKKKGML